MRTKVNRSGSVFIGVTILLGVAAANTGNNLLYMVVSAMLSLMLVSGIFSLINIKGLELVLIPPKEVFANRPAVFRLLLRKKGFFPSFLIRVSYEGFSCMAPVVDNKGAECTLEIKVPKRGRIEALKLEVSSDFPLGMFVRIREVNVYMDLIVFPEPIPVRLEAVLSGKDGGNRANIRSTSKGFEEIKNVKPYDGEPIKLIHWKLSAKRGELLVKELSGEDRGEVVLSLDMVSGSLEEKLSKLTYIVLELIKEGYAVGLELGDTKIPPRRGERHKRFLLSKLALY